MGLAERILGTAEQLDEMFIPEWNETVWIRPITGRQRRHIEKMFDNEIDDLGKATLVAYSVCDSEGVRLWTDDQIEQVADLNCIAIERVVTRAMHVSKLTVAAVEELEKNSLNGHLSDSTTVSP